jgi:tetratricopeptide (TPR) repeat protein
MMKKIFAILWISLFSSAYAGENSWFRIQDESLHQITLRIGELVMQTKYKDAELQLSKLPAEYVEHPASCFLQSMISLARYDDLGGVSTLKKLNLYLEQCVEKIEKKDIAEKDWWLALLGFQKGYTEQALGDNLSAALSMRSATKYAENISYSDAQSFQALYSYYMDQLTAGISWIPFVDDNRSQHILQLKKAAKHSLYFKTLFSNALIWIYYERKEYQAALNLTRSLLKRNPQHPVFLQIEADMYFRLQEYQRAAQIYEENRRLYSVRAPGSVRYYSATANLMRIYQESAEPDKVAKIPSLQSEFKTDSYTVVRPYMPASLLNDLAERNLLND